MRQLRFVGLAEDGTHLLLQPPEGDEDFALALDDGLRAAVAGPPAPPLSEEPAPSDEAPSVTERSPIVPREIQMRVRAGESPEEVAESLGVPLARIIRFAAAAVDERRRIAEEARRARARHTAPEGTDAKIVVFGEAVDSRFSAHGIVASDVTWDAHRREDGEWVVVARWIGGTGEHQAEWVFQRASRTVTPADDAAADLLSDRPIRPVTPPPPPPRLVVAPPLAPGVVAFPPMPEAHTGPIGVVEEVFDQEAEPEPTPPPVHPSFGSPRHAAPVQETARMEPAIDFDAPPLPLGIVDPSSRPAAKREPTEEERATRARIPSWDDILLGVRRKSD
jgi:hypothetical protein